MPPGWREAPVNPHTETCTDEELKNTEKVVKKWKEIAEGQSQVFEAVVEVDSLFG